MTTTEVNEISARLAAPFDASEVKWKPQTVSGNRALAIPFVDARAVQDRLDEVLGVMGWSDTYECLPDGAVVCKLSIRLGDEWIAKMDVGGQSEQPDEGDRRKAAFSDALKRAAVKFGVGRHLYRLKPQWCDYDPQRRQFLRPPTLPGTAAPKPAEKPKPGKVFAEAARFAKKCQAAGLCMAVDVRKHLEAALGKKWGDGDGIENWPDAALEDVKAACVAFKAEREKALAASQAKAG